MNLDNFINSLNRKFFIYLSKQEKIKDIALNNALSKKIARRWIAGETLAEAIDVAKKLNLEGKLVTIDHLGEDVKNPEEARIFADECCNILSGINAENLESNISLKLTQQGIDINQDFCFSNIEKIAETAKGYGNFVRIDMEGSPHTQKTIDIFKRIREKYDNIGIVVQSYLYRTENDVKELLGLGTNFRLCKGAYREPANIAFPQKKDVDKNYIKLSEKLLLDGSYQAFATHDENMIEHIKKFAKEKGIGQDDFEFQMLYGVRRNIQNKLVDEGYNLRVYVPYGRDWYPYNMRRLAESWHNVMFILKDVF